MYYYTRSNGGRIVHTGQCRYRKAISETNLGFIELSDTLYRSNMRFCKCCNPLAAKYRAEKETLMNYCRQNGCSIRITDCSLLVSTPRSCWQIVAADNRTGTQLYHKNEVQRDGDSDSMVRKYHNQKVCYGSILQYLEYISDHDYYRMLNPCVNLTPKAPPRKGTKRYRKQQKREKRHARQQSIRNVLRLIDGLQTFHPQCPTL